MRKWNIVIFALTLEFYSYLKYIVTFDTAFTQSCSPIATPFAEKFDRAFIANMKDVETVTAVTLYLRLFV